MIFYIIFTIDLEYSLKKTSVHFNYTSFETVLSQKYVVGRNLYCVKNWSRLLIYLFAKPSLIGAFWELIFL